MNIDKFNFTLIGGPTGLLEIGNLRLLTDPTFDPAGEEYRTPLYTLRKTVGPAIAAESIGHIDAVLLSHDHHFDNLDHNGRTLLQQVQTVLTTQAGAGRLGANALGLAPWESTELAMADGRTLRVTATPARHGPSGGDRGPVIGFVLSVANSPQHALYVSGDTVFYEGVPEVGRRFPVDVAILFMGAARVPEVGPSHLTFTAQEAVQAARALPNAMIVPLHCEGWAHFSESRSDIDKAFMSAGLHHRLLWADPGRPVTLGL